MHDFSLAHLSDDSLLRDLTLLVLKERRDTAWILAHIAEVDARKLYVPAGCSSMHAYCVEELHLSEDGALRRIQAARAARAFPQLFKAVGQGLLHLTAVCLLAPHLSANNVDELIEAASHRRKDEILDLLARRLTQVQPAGLLHFSQHALAHVEHAEELPSTDAELVQAQVEPAPREGESAPVEHFVQLMVRASTRDRIRYAQSLLSHALPTGDPSDVLNRALDLLIAQVERRKMGKSVRRATLTAPSRDKRHVPAHVRQAVWQRDGGRCNYVSRNGRRCTARRSLEFDHVTPVARGGEATVDGIRLRCRAHNQFEAERVFGSEFMKKKREEARRAKAVKTDVTSSEVIAGLRNLGVNAIEARRAAEHSKLHGEQLEDRLRAALKFLSRAPARV